MNMLEEYTNNITTTAINSAITKNIKNDNLWVEKKNENNENLIMLSMLQYR